MAERGPTGLSFPRGSIVPSFSLQNVAVALGMPETGPNHKDKAASGDVGHLHPVSARKATMRLRNSPRRRCR